MEKSGNLTFCQGEYSATAPNAWPGCDPLLFAPKSTATLFLQTLLYNKILSGKLALKSGKSQEKVREIEKWELVATLLPSEESDELVVQTSSLIFCAVREYYYRVY